MSVQLDIIDGEVIQIDIIDDELIIVNSVNGLISAASQSEVDAGLVTNKYINPATLSAWTVPALSWKDNARQTFNPGANQAGINVGAVAANPDTPVNGDIIYRSDTNLFQLYQNGSWVGVGGSITASNGLTKVGNDIRLGGTLTGNTTISRNGFNLTLGNIVSTNDALDINTDAPTISINSNLASSSVNMFGAGGFNGFLAASTHVDMYTDVIDLVFNVADTSGSATFSDQRTSPQGLEYVSDYSSTYSNRSLTDIGSAWKTLNKNTSSIISTNPIWIATANNNYHMNFGGSFTARATASDVLKGYKFTPTLTASAASQILRAVEIIPTFVPGVHDPTQQALYVNGNIRFDGGLIGIRVTPDKSYIHLEAPTIMSITGNQGTNIRIKSTNGDALYQVHTASTTNFAGVEYLTAAGVAAVFTGFQQSTGQFRFNNVFSGGYIDFLIASNSALRIDNSRKIGINFNTTPSAQLQIRGAGIGIGATVLIEDSEQTPRFKLLDNGNLFLSDGANRTMGVTTLVNGTVTVSNTLVTANTRIYLTAQNDTGGVPTDLHISARVAGTSFTITSTDGASDASVAWLLLEPQ